jgi:hypothetical protein
MQYLPKPRAATSVATNIATFPLRNSEIEQQYGKKGSNNKYQAGYKLYKRSSLYKLITLLLYTGRNSKYIST